MKRTYVKEEEVCGQYDRLGFWPASTYGTMKPEPHEVGCIAEESGAPVGFRQGFRSLPLVVTERVFCVPGGADAAEGTP